MTRNATFDFDAEPEAEVNADVGLFEQITAAKAAFFDTVVDCAADSENLVVRELRQETIHQVAEFFYLLKVFKINNPKFLRQFAEIHTNKVRELLENAEMQETLGVYAQRLQDAMFDNEEKLMRLEANCGHEMVRLSQSDLGRLLVEYMSPETCRHAVKTLNEAGYLNITKSPFGALLVSSTGKLEQIFARYIRELRLSL